MHRRRGQRSPCRGSGIREWHRPGLPSRHPHRPTRHERPGLYLLPARQLLPESPEVREEPIERAASRGHRHRRRHAGLRAQAVREQRPEPAHQPVRARGVVLLQRHLPVSPLCWRELRHARQPPQRDVGRHRVGQRHGAQVWRPLGRELQHRPRDARGRDHRRAHPTGRALSGVDAHRHAVDLPEAVGDHPGAPGGAHAARGRNHHRPHPKPLQHVRLRRQEDHHPQHQLLARRAQRLSRDRIHRGRLCQRPAGRPLHGLPASETQAPGRHLVPVLEQTGSGLLRRRALIGGRTHNGRHSNAAPLRSPPSEGNPILRTQ
mmetsp:Transcript_4439/g.11077  ORF Transcript_4439/g.11077 Transcript_4439/m.11077 type:complete len:319 (-) Transcript_4439:60-1016(-)